MYNEEKLQSEYDFFSYFDENRIDIVFKIIIRGFSDTYFIILLVFLQTD